MEEAGRSAADLSAVIVADLSAVIVAGLPAVSVADLSAVGVAEIPLLFNGNTRMRDAGTGDLNGTNLQRS